MKQSTGALFHWYLKYDVLNLTLIYVFKHKWIFQRAQWLSPFLDYFNLPKKKSFVKKDIEKWSNFTAKIGMGRFTDAPVHHGIYFDDYILDRYIYN